MTGTDQFKQKLISNDKKLIILIILLLLIPQVNYYVYYSISSLVLLFALFRSRISFNKYSIFIGIILIYLIFITIFRVFLNYDENIKDFIELSKLLPFLLVFFMINELDKIRIGHLAIGIFSYMLLDGIVTYVQFYKFDNLSFFNALSAIYNNPTHVERSLSWASRRALGLSSGPSDHGALASFSFVFMLSLFLFGKKLKKMALIGVVVSLAVVFLSQSKTAIVTCLIMTPIIVGYYLTSREISIKRFLLLLFFLIPSFTLIILNHYDEFKQLEKLSNLLEGGVISSYNARLEKWYGLTLIASENPVWQLFGLGRAYLGDDGRVFDNDYVYIYLVHGLILFSFLVFYILSYVIIKTLNCNKLPLEEKMLLFLILTGLIFSSSAAFITSPRITMLFAILFAVVYHVNREFVRTAVRGLPNEVKKIELR